MAGNDSWQRDQYDRERGMSGIVTGGSANLEALRYRDAQLKITQSINDNLYKSFDTGKVVGAPKPVLLPSIPTGATVTSPVSTTPLIMLLVVISGAVAFLLTGSSLKTGLVMGASGAALFGLRAFFRIEKVQRLFHGLFMFVLKGMALGFVALLIVLFVGWIAAIFYAVWWMAGSEVTAWVAAGTLGLIALLWGIGLADKRYRAFARTPEGKRIVRQVGLAKFTVKLGIMGFVIWWVAGALEFI